MGKQHRKVLMGLLTVFMMCVIVSTATTTVTAAADGWGTLKAGDEMQWQSDIYGTVKMKIISVDGNTISLELTEGGNTVSHTVDAGESLSDANMRSLSPWLIPLEQKGAYSFSTTTYEFEGTTYQAYYSKTSGDRYEKWYDTNTGILFEARYTEADDTVSVDGKLTSCTADLAESTGGGGGGGCLGTVLIALVSITTVVSYGLVRYRKKTV